MVLDVEEVKENQDALEGLLRKAGLPNKWIKLALVAYVSETACNNAQKELFDRVFQPVKWKN